MIAKIKKDPLLTLVKSLTKSEKRQFRLEWQNLKEQPPLFFLLYEFIDAAEEFNESELTAQYPNIKKRQLSNLKAELYHHLLETLRNLSVRKDTRLQIRQQIDFSQVLYGKGLYKQSLAILGRVRKVAEAHQELEFEMEILEFEKLIEARHITRSIENRADQLRNASEACMERLYSLSKLSNLALSLYGIYLKMGHVRNKEDRRMVNEFFQKHLPSHLLESSAGKIRTDRIAGLTFYEKVNLYQAQSWHAYILQDFILFYRNTRKWVDLFEDYPEQKMNDPSLYLKAYNNLLTAHFFNQNFKQFQRSLDEIEQFYQSHEKSFDRNTRTLAFVHIYTAKLNLHLLEGTFVEGQALIPRILERIQKFYLQLDQHRILVFYYKIACLYFGSNEFENTILYLNKIINLKIGNLRTDIQCFARVLFLLCHYELKNYNITEYLFPSVFKFLEKNRDLSKVLEETLVFFKKLSRSNSGGSPRDFKQLKTRLEEISQDPYEKRSFLYLDIISWLESKIEGVPVQDIIQEKFKKRIPRF